MHILLPVTIVCFLFVLLWMIQNPVELHEALSFKSNNGRIKDHLISIVIWLFVLGAVTGVVLISKLMLRK